MTKNPRISRYALYIGTAMLLLALNSCATTLKAAKLENPESSFIACRADLTITENLIYNEVATVSFSDPTRENRFKNKAIVTKKRTTGATYRIIEIKPGTYRVPAPRYSFKGFLGMEYGYKWQLPAEMNAIFKVNPGEVVYVGDFLINHDEKKPELDVQYDMAACRAALVKQYPALEGFIWISSFADREAF